MKKGISILIAVLFLGTAFGQDEKAKVILDKVSEKTNRSASTVIHFELIISGAETEPISENGITYIAGEKYKIELVDQDIYCDGKTIATHLKEDAECYITYVDDTIDDATISPNELLTIWEDGYTYKYVQESTYKGRAVHQISLFPIDATNNKFSSIMLKIDKEMNELIALLIQGKDGTNMKYSLTKVVYDLSIPASRFVFDHSKHPDVEVYDE